MARDIRRAFLTTLEMTQTQQAQAADWDRIDRDLNDPEYIPPAFEPGPDPLDLMDQPLDEVSAYASLIQTLRDAQHHGLGSDKRKAVATQLNALNLRDMPSLEAFCAFPDNAVTVSLEALRNSIKDTLKAILQALAKFWAALMDMVQHWLESSRLIRARVLIAQGKLRDVAGLEPKQDMVSGSLIPWLSTDELAADNAHNILINLKGLAQQITTLRQSYLPMVVKITQQFIAQFEQWQTGQQWDGVDASQWLEGLNLIAEQYEPARALGAKHPYGDRQAAHWRADALMTDCMPGYRWMVVIPAMEVGSSYPTIAKANVLQGARVVVEDVYGRWRKAPGEMRTMSQHEIEMILAQTEVVVKEIEALTHSDARRSLREMTLRLDRMANSNLTVPDGSVAIFQAGVAYARAVSRWAKDPYQGVVLHALNVCNNSVQMCGRHTRAYKSAPNPKETNP